MSHRTRIAAALESLREAPVHAEEKRAHAAGGRHVQVTTSEVADRHEPQVAQQGAVVLVQPANQPGVRDIVAQKQQEGWSPTKAQSLAFFLAGSAAAAAAGGPSSDAPGAVVVSHGSAAENCPPCTAQQQRPYLGLKYLLRSGPSGSEAPKTWTKTQQETALLQAPANQARPPPRAVAPLPPAPGRYAPYALPPTGAARNRYCSGPVFSKTDLNRYWPNHLRFYTDSILPACTSRSSKPPVQPLPAPPQPADVRGYGHNPLTPYPHAQLKAAASAGVLLYGQQQAPQPPRLPSPARAAMPPPAAAAASMPLLSPVLMIQDPSAGSGRGAASRQQQQQLAGTPMPRKVLFQGPPSVQVVGVVGAGACCPSHPPPDPCRRARPRPQGRRR